MDPLILSVSVALGIGLAIGLERERSQSAADGGEDPAGLRTFAVASLSGAICAMLPDRLLLPLALLGATVLAAISYQRSANRDAGLTTEFASAHHPAGRVDSDARSAGGGLCHCRGALAAWQGVPASHRAQRRHPRGNERCADPGCGSPDRLAAAARPLHGAARRLESACALAGRAAGAAGRAAGHIFARMFGEHFGLPMTGLFGGFVSSVATIGAMAVRARKADSPVHGPVDRKSVV